MAIRNVYDDAALLMQLAGQAGRGDRAVREHQISMDRANLDLANRREDRANRQFQYQQDMDVATMRLRQSEQEMARRHDLQIAALSGDRQAQYLLLQDRLVRDRQTEAEQRARDSVRWQFTEKQRQQMQALTEKADWIREQDDWTPEQKAHAIQQIEQRMLGIEPMPIPDDSPFPPGQRSGEVWADNSGATLTRDDKGNVKVLIPPPKPADSWAPDLKDIAALIKQAGDALTTVDPETGKTSLPSEEDVQQYVTRAIRIRQQWMQMIDSEQTNIELDLNLDAAMTGGGSEIPGWDRLMTPGLQSDQPAKLPKDTDGLVDGMWYETPRGVKRWNGMTRKFED